MRGKYISRLIKPDATDENWEYYGKNCPYFGVVSWPKFREGMDGPAKEEFFQTGETYVARLFDAIEESLQIKLEPRRALDFGCGVGRLLIPLSVRCGEVIGVDVSKSMLAEAEKNLREKGCENVSLVNSLEALPEEPKLDFVHSFIVFQHIRPERGLPLIRRLIGALREGGIGALHLSYASAAGKRERLLLWLHRKFPLLHGLAQLQRGRAFSEPLMDMAEYPLNDVFAALQDAGCHHCAVRFTRHGVRGITVIFRKTPLEEI